MKLIRWLTFLPIAIIGSLFASFLFNWICHFIIPDWKVLKFVSVFIWIGSGVITTTVWMAIGQSVAPVRNKLIKWVLLIPLLLITAGALIGSIFGDGAVTNIPSSSINGNAGQILLCSAAFLTAIIFIFQVPELSS